MRVSAPPGRCARRRTPGAGRTPSPRGRPGRSPTTSSSSSIRKPIVRSISLPMMKAITNEKLPTANTATVCLPSRLNPSAPPPYRMPVAPATLLGAASRPIRMEPTAPPTRWTPTTSSESSKPSRYFRPTAYEHSAPAVSPEGDRTHRGHAGTRGRDRDEAGDGSGSSAQCGRVTITDLLDEQPAEHRSRRGDLGVHEGHRGCAVRTEGRAGVEAEPAEPQQSGAKHHQRKAVRAHLVPTPAHPLAEHDREGETGCAGVDVDRSTAGEVEHAPLGQPTGPVAVRIAEAEDPVRNREVDNGDPHRDEDGPGTELGPVRDRSRDERGRDHREHQLERREDEDRDRVLPTVDRDLVEHVAQTDSAEVADEAVGVFVAERQREAEQHPQRGDDADRQHAHHQHVEHGLGADHAAVEEGKARGHEQHERGAHEDPGGVACVDVHPDGPVDQGAGTHHLGPVVQQCPHLGGLTFHEATRRVALA